MNEKNIELVLRNNSMNLFSDSWYFNTAEKIFQLFNENKKGYVYFIRSEISGYVKIGVAKNINNRLNTLKQNNGQIYLIGFLFIDNYVQKEKELHLKYKNSNKYGEWFGLKIEEIKSLLSVEKGIIIEKNYNNSLIIEDGEILKKETDIEIENNVVFLFFKENIVLNELYNKDDFYKKMDIKSISKKKMTMFIQKYCKINGLELKEFRTHNSRNFIVS